jgi:ubiquitin carboxyl-terminal hydrolase 25/28
MVTATEPSGTAVKVGPQLPGPLQSSIQDGDIPDDIVDGFLFIGGLDKPVQDPSSPMTDRLPDVEDAALDSDLKTLLSQYGFVEVEAPQPCAKEPAQKLDDAAFLPPSDLDEFWENFVAEEKAEREHLMAERDIIFSDCHDVAYRLHAVVCHAGSSASAGHYWVWIHDFERDVWRKYNDTTVSVHPADFVFGELNTKGEPYYLAYVRADEVRNLVSIPCRQQRTPPPVPPRPRSTEDTAMTDADNIEVSVEHLEDVDMSTPAYFA